MSGTITGTIPESEDCQEVEVVRMVGGRIFIRQGRRNHPSEQIVDFDSQHIDLMIAALEKARPVNNPTK